MIHVFIGTKPEYVKMAPLLARMDAEEVPYRLIDSGQHAELAASFRDEIGLRAPDVQLGRGRDAKTIPEAMLWTLSLSRHSVSRSRLRGRVFGGHDGVCVVHGDTPTTLVGALLAKRAGMALAHVEAGLRTFRWRHPFPEEIVRVTVGRLADVLFAPGPVAAQNLRSTGVKGRIVEQQANTLVESVRAILGSGPDAVADGRAGAGTDAVTGGSAGAGPDAVAGGSAGAGPDAVAGGSAAIVTMHRVENLHLRSRRLALVDVLCEAAAATPVRWVLHAPTERILAGPTQQRLVAAGVELVPQAPHRQFLEMVAAAPFVITDGGSIQEECAMLGVPALLWRDSTDRPDGLGENVVLSHYDEDVVGEFLRDPQRYRRPGRVPGVSPTEQILDELGQWR